MLHVLPGSVQRVLTFKKYRNIIKYNFITITFHSPALSLKYQPGQGPAPHVGSESIIAEVTGFLQFAVYGCSSHLQRTAGASECVAESSNAVHRCGLRHPG